MTDLTEACAAYFKAHPAYHRILTLFLKKYTGFGRAAGTVCLPDATQEECDAARALFGRSFSAPLRIKTADFEAALQQTPYRGVDLKEVLECYFGTVIQTKHEISDQIDACIMQMTQEVRGSIQSETCCRWLDELSNKRGEGYLLIRKSLGKDNDAVQRAIRYACKGVEWLEQHPGEPIRLAVLSANAASDPHAFDSNTLCGKLFLHLLAARSSLDFPSTAENRAAVYYECGILCDSISSSVTQVGLCLYAHQEEHPAYRAFRLRNEVCTLTLTNLANITDSRSASGKAYLVENQMVFSQLSDHAADFHSPLICTSGQPTVAVIRLLDLLVASGTDLFYSGDFDGKGLSIALQLFRRYPDRLHLWHMSPSDYVRCRSDVKLSKDSRTLLRGCESSILAQTADAVRKSGYDGYQELLLSELQADLTETP